MKNNFIKQTTTYIAAIAVTLGAVSCSKLDEQVYGTKSVASASTGASTADLNSVYGQLGQLSGQYGWHALQVHSTDELLGPTRGTDWDDFGTWRKIHLHATDGAHNQIFDTWNGLNGALFQATLVAEKSTGAAQLEGKFLRAFFATQVMDIYGQVPYRAAADGPDKIPAVKTRSEAFDWIMKDVDDAIAGLPNFGTGSDMHKANKQAAQFLKARLLLNKAVYKADPKTPTTFSFVPADMDQVITLVNAIEASGKFALSTGYWDNFKWDNYQKSTELILSRATNGPGKATQTGGNTGVTWATGMGTHYNQSFSGWNGFTTTADFYNSFADGDQRKTAELAGSTDVNGLTAGFMAGQQFKYVGGKKVEVTDRSGGKLVFSPDVSLFFSTESKGIRTNKYPLKGDQMGFNEENEFVIFRYADALLMKAEALLRTGKAADALVIVNNIRKRANATNLSAVTLNDLLAERGRELYLEGSRRTDMIRFGKYNDPVIERPLKSDAFRVVYPIPNQAVSSNPNLKQNFGY
ncbi:MAG: RagB/SusD family nutrient uptake outer membrane protein [Sediminibacterium sp.]